MPALGAALVCCPKPNWMLPYVLGTVCWALFTFEVCTISSVTGMVGVVKGSVPTWYKVPVLLRWFKRIAWPVVKIEVLVLFLEDVVSFSLFSGGNVNVTSKYCCICPAKLSSVWCASSKTLLICSLTPCGMLEKGRSLTLRWLWLRLFVSFTAARRNHSAVYCICLVFWPGGVDVWCFELLAWLCLYSMESWMESSLLLFWNILLEGKILPCCFSNLPPLLSGLDNVVWQGMSQIWPRC